MGLPFESVGERACADLLAQQREAYAPDHLPAGVLTVTAGVDTQKDRLEIELVGWGAGEESWGIEHIVLHGNPAEPRYGSNWMAC
jgi:phage terminase large subunit GpA-like protein